MLDADRFHIQINSPVKAREVALPSSIIADHKAGARQGGSALCWIYPI